MQDIEENREYEIYSFFTNPKNDDQTVLRCMEGKDNPVFAEESTDVGHKYQIMLLRDHKEDKEKFADLDIFEAILAHPLTYIRPLIKSGWYGIVIRKSDKSQEFLDDALAEIKEFL